MTPKPQTSLVLGFKLEIGGSVVKRYGMRIGGLGA